MLTLRSLMGIDYISRSRAALNDAIRAALVAAYGHLAEPGGPLYRVDYVAIQPGESSAKLIKNADETHSVSAPQYRVWMHRETGAIVHVRPDNVAEWHYLGNACPKGDTCFASCIGEAGRYGMGIKATRTWVRALNHCAPRLLDELIVADLRRLNARAIRMSRKNGKRYVIAIRLNVITDIRWETRINLASFSALTFYDYTKIKRSQRAESENYSLTSSAHRGLTVADIVEMVNRGQNVAVVVPTADDAESPTFAGLPAINGDLSDARYLDPRGVVVLLRVKFTGINGHESIYREGMVRDVVTGEIVYDVVKVSRAPRRSLKVTAESFVVSA